MIEAKVNIEEIKEKIEGIDESLDLSMEQQKSVEEVIHALDQGIIRVADPTGDSWTVNEWIKKSISMYFKIKKLKPINSGDISYFDKIDCFFFFKIFILTFPISS